MQQKYLSSSLAAISALFLSFCHKNIQRTHKMKFKLYIVAEVYPLICQSLLCNQLLLNCRSVHFYLLTLQNNGLPYHRFIIVMFADKSEREIQRLQTLLNRCKWEKQQLEHQSTAKDQLIETLNSRNAALQSAKTHYSSANLYKEQNSEKLEQKSNRLEQYIKEQAYEGLYLQKINGQIIKQVESLQQTITQHMTNLAEKDLLISSLRLNIKELEEINKIQNQQIQSLNKTIETYCTKKLKLIQENVSLKTKFKQQQHDKQIKFKAIFQGLNALTSQMKQKSDQAHQTTIPKGGDQKLLLKLQQEDLQERNEEIMRLRTILDGVEVPVEESHLRNTIKHLRAELYRYNTLITKILEKEQAAENIIKKHAELIKKYEMELTNVSELKKQNQTLKANINDQSAQLKQLGDLLQSYKKKEQDVKAVLIEALKQNQCYHQMMYDTYGPTYQYFIEKNSDDYFNRLNERIQKEKWVTIDELIKVNQKLRERLKIV